MLHFNSAGDGLMPGPVLAAQQAHLTREAEIGGYEAADEATPRLEAAYASIARLLGARADEIALVRNTSEANNTINNGLPLGPGDEVVIWDQNHPTNNVAWDVRAARFGSWTTSHLCARSRKR